MTAYGVIRSIPLELFSSYRAVSLYIRLVRILAKFKEFSMSRKVQSRDPEPEGPVTGTNGTVLVPGSRKSFALFVQPVLCNGVCRQVDTLVSRWRCWI
jgi:hypothetical protein